MPTLLRWPLTGWPNERVLQRAVDEVGRLADSSVRMFYVGRTCDPEKRCREHGADAMHVIYESDSDDNAYFVEDVLIKVFDSHPKCDNRSGHCGGGRSVEYRHCVYVAVWR